MTRIMKTTIAALFGATMLAGPALAQTDGSSSAPSNTESSPLKIEPGADAKMAVDSNTTAAVDSTFDGAMGMIGDSSVANTIKSMPDVGEVRIVGMSELSGVDGDMPRLDQALAQNDAQVQELRSAIAGNSAITAELQAHNKSASDVIAADVAANGSVIVYTR